MMRFILERVSEPEAEPVSVAEFVRNAGEFAAAATEREDDIERLITAAREWAEDDTGRALIDQTWRLTLTDQTGIEYDAVTQPPCGYYTGAWRANAGEILLRRSPIIELLTFRSVDAEGTETAVDADTYELREADSKWPKIVGLNGATWTTGTFRITYRAGYADRDVSPPEGGEKVPARFRQAILLHAQAFYDMPEKVEKWLETAQRLITPERCHIDFA